MKVTKWFTRLAVSLAIFACVSCNSNKPIPDDLTAKELIQQGQEAFERGRNKDSLRYFNAVVDRYGSDPALYIEARYEIGHLYMKKKNYDSAVPVLDELVALYANYPPGTFPAAYEKLAKLELAKVPEEKAAEIRARQQEKLAALAAAEAAALQEDVRTVSDEDYPLADQDAAQSDDEAALQEELEQTEAVEP